MPETRTTGPSPALVPEQAGIRIVTYQGGHHRLTPSGGKVICSASGLGLHHREDCTHLTPGDSRAVTYPDGDGLTWRRLADMRQGQRRSATRGIRQGAGTAQRTGPPGHVPLHGMRAHTSADKRPAGAAHSVPYRRTVYRRPVRLGGRSRLRCTAVGRDARGVSRGNVGGTATGELRPWAEELSRDLLPSGRVPDACAR